ncbi:MAG: crossover junction endodeoxyribonuclease RuvC [Chloroflexota bacterium]
MLGIDPGLNITGYGVVDRTGRRLSIVEAGVIRPGRADHPLEQRLDVLATGVESVIAQFRPEAMSLEQVFSHSRFPMAALWMAHARGVVCLTAARAGIPVHSYAPTMVKLSLVGQGRATKEQVQHMVALRFGLPKPPEPPDVADALALAITHLVATAHPALAVVD